MTKIEVDDKTDGLAIKRLAKQKGVPGDAIEVKTSILGRTSVIAKDQKYENKVLEAADEYSKLKKKYADLSEPEQENEQTDKADNPQEAQGDN